MDDEFFDVTTSSIKESEDSAAEAETERKAPSRPKPMPKQLKAAKSYAAYQPQAVFLYHPDLELPDLAAQIGAHIEVRVERCYLTLQNKNIQRRRLFGGEDYTSNSDLAAVLFHAGLAREEAKRGFELVGVILKVTNHKRVYAGSAQNGVQSRTLINAQNNPSFRGQTLRPVAVRNFQTKTDLYRLAQRLQLPLHRARCPPAHREPDHAERFGELVFNASHELALRYSLTNICDKSEKPQEFLSHLLQSHFLVLETQAREKFALFAAKDRAGGAEAVYRLFAVRNPAGYDNEQVARDPLAALQLLRDEFVWSDLVWASDRVELKDRTIEAPTSFKLYRL